MKLLLIGCLHGSIPAKLKIIIKREKPDYVLCSGDLCDTDMLRDLEFGNWNSPEILRALFDKKKYDLLVRNAAKSMQIPLNFLKSLKSPVYLVYGNNDFLDKQLKKMGLGINGLESRLPDNVVLLKAKLLRLDGIYLAGLSGYRSFEEKKKNKNGLCSILRRFDKKLKYPEKTIFLTHDVPFKKFDLVKCKNSPAYGLHVGERSLNAYLKVHKLLAFICSHMHEHQGIDELYGTPVINSGYGRSGKCAVLETENGKLSKIRFFR
jgi:Icc-related predicted phosphoesterase